MAKKERPRGVGNVFEKDKAISSPVGATRLSVASFSCGTCVMVLEMAGSRVVAPYMGTSLIVWTSLIGIVMASLSLGYWMGGVVSDRRPDPGLLARIIGGAALSTALLAVLAGPLLSFVARNVSNVYVGSVVAALCLFAVPSFLLGMVSPFIVRLAMHSLGSAGTTVGRFSALSSAGSILGTFLGGFVLISFFSSRTILFLVAAVLAATALPIYRRGWKALSPIVVVSVGMACLSEAGAMPMIPEGISIDTRYNSILVTERVSYATGRRVRILQTDPMGAQSLMYVDNPAELYSDYTKFYDLAFHYNPGVKKVLMLGGGGYCVPKHLAATRPDVSIDVVEIDPGITDVAKKYFYLKDRLNQRIFHEDARRFLNRTAAARDVEYDAVFEDVFGSSYNIPFHLTTVECMEKVKALLSPEGVFIANIISSVDDELFSGIYASVAEVFPTVMIFPATYPQGRSIRQNVMIVALPAETIPQREPESLSMASLLAHRLEGAFTPKISAFTDRFAPVEKYSLLD